MKANIILETEGSITQKETLVPIEYRTLGNSLVLEAESPYANYYGRVPYLCAPNTLFLLTKKFCKLDELLKISCEMKGFCSYIKKLDVATSILDFTDHYNYAIRIRDFTDYDHIHWLQSCYHSKGGADFHRKVHLSKHATVTTFKRFKLEEMADGVYLDKTNDHRAYVIIPWPINSEIFSEKLINLRNNNDCVLFDAALGTIDIDLKQQNMIRVCSENLNIGLLKSIQQKFTEPLLKEKL